MPKYRDPATGEIIEVGSPELNPELVAGKELVPETTPFSLGSITSESLAPTPSSEFKSPQDTTLFPVSALGTIPLELAQPEKEAETITGELRKLTGQLVGESAFRAEQERVVGIPELRKTVQDFTARLNTLKAEAAAIPLRLQEETKGRGITAGGLRPIETGFLRQNAIQALSVASLLEASRGNLTMALDLVDRAVSQKFDPIRETINAKLTNLDLILKSPAYSLAEKRRAEAQKAKQEEAKRKLDEGKDIATDNYKLAVDVAKTGKADALTLEKIQKAKTREEAFALGATYLKTEEKLPSDIETFKQFFPNVDLTTLEGQEKYLEWKARKEVVPGDIGEFQRFFPDVDITTPAGQQKFLDWEARVATTNVTILKGIGEIQEIKDIENRLILSRKGGEFADGNIYLEERRKSKLGPDEFDKRFGSLLSPEDRQKYGIAKSTEIKAGKEERIQELLRKSNNGTNLDALTPDELTELYSSL